MISLRRFAIIVDALSAGTCRTLTDRFDLTLDPEYTT